MMNMEMSKTIYRKYKNTCSQFSPEHYVGNISFDNSCSESNIVANSKIQNLVWGLAIGHS